MTVLTGLRAELVLALLEHSLSFHAHVLAEIFAGCERVDRPDELVAVSVADEVED